LGWTDVAVIEAGELAGGTTSHAPGLVGQLRSSVSLTRMLMYSVQLYRTLEIEGEPGFSEVGSLRLASSPERLEELERQVGFAQSVGLEAHLLGPGEAKTLFPLMDTTAVEGALYLPHDGSATATVLTRAMIRRARELGVAFFPHTRMSEIELEHGRVLAIRCSAGRIETENVIVAAGIWSPLLGRMAGVSLPLIPMQHQYARSAPLPALAGRRLPNLRDPDRLVYVRQDGKSFVLGGYERNPERYASDAIPEGPNATIRPFDPPRFTPLHEALLQRIPALRSLALQDSVNGLESFTPDGEFLLGPSTEVKGFWAACGFCAHGVSGAGGVGKMMAEWIVEGEPSLDLWHMDLRRAAHATGARYIRQRVGEIYSTYYDISYPFQERSSARELRLSPMYDQLRSLGAAFGEKSGWERANWFSPNAGLAKLDIRPRRWAKRDWSPAIAAEHEATRRRVGLFDVTSFSKFEVGGPGALHLLQYLAANEMDKPLGAITYTQLLNRRGGIECDLTVTRLAHDRFRLITGTAFGTHDLHWIRRHLPADGSVYALDLTSSLCCVGMWGPNARDVLQRETEDDVGDKAFPYLTARSIAVGPVPVLALRVTYVGELGWEMYAPMEYGRVLWDVLWEAGGEYGMLAAGYRAIDSLRLEKGYRYWSTDIHSEYNPYEAGLGFAVRLRKGDFLGRMALLEAKERGLQRKLCCLALADGSAVALGGEPLMDGNHLLGRVTSGGYGYTVERSIAYGYLPIEYSEPGTTVDVLWFGERIAATVEREPLYDPTNSRIKEVSAVTVNS
jgi:glycine cleavage system aminomethyltransferase T/glycine/D-amino acid oxidase-like deaminating enzyme